MTISIKVVDSLCELSDAVAAKEADVVIHEYEQKDVNTKELNGTKYCDAVLVDDDTIKVFSDNQLDEFSNWDINRVVAFKSCYRIKSNSSSLIQSLKNVFSVVKAEDKIKA